MLGKTGVGSTLTLAKEVKKVLLLPFSCSPGHSRSLIKRRSGESEKHLTHSFFIQFFFIHLVIIEMYYNIKNCIRSRGQKMVQSGSNLVQ